MKKTLLYSLAVTLCICSYGQAGWNWPEDPELNTLAKEKQAYYKLLLAQDKYAEAMAPLNWLYENNPNLHQSIYIEGETTLEKLMEEADDERKEALRDSVLWMYDQRIAHFENDANVTDRKAYQAFQFYYNKPAKYPMLAEFYAKAYELNGSDIMTVNLSPYMFLAKLYHQRKPETMTAEMVLDIHSTISEYIEVKRKGGESEKRLKKEQDKTDAYLSSIDGILTCEFIENKLVPKFRENPGDVANAKKIFNYSLQAKCIDQPYWLEASETVYKEQPSFKLAVTLGNKYNASGEPDKAISYLEEAAKLASSNNEKYDALIGQATANSKKGNKTRARTLAYEALSAKPGSAQAYNLIGNLYFTSYDDCKGGKSKVLDRGVFLAAYDMYQKAGNTSQMKASKEQFPSVEEIFTETYKDGQSITVGCWINQTVSIQTRD